MIFNMGGGGGLTPEQTLDETTITPGTENQVIPSGTFLRGDLTVLGDADLIPANIAKGKNIFGVAGTFDPVSKETDLIPSNIRQGVDILGVVGTMVEGDGTWVETTVFTATSNKTVYSAHSNPNAVYGLSKNSSGTSCAYRGYIGTQWFELQGDTSYNLKAYTYSGTIKISGNAITVEGVSYRNSHYLAICHV